MFKMPPRMVQLRTMADYMKREPLFLFKKGCHNSMSFLSKVYANLEASNKPTKAQIVKWAYGNCWSFAVALLDVFHNYRAKIVLDENGSPDHALAIDPQNKFAIDATGVTPISKFKTRYRGCKMVSLYNDDDPQYIFEIMSKDYSDPGYEISDAVAFVKKYKDYYDVTQNQDSYSITQKDVDAEN